MDLLTTDIVSYLAYARIDGVAGQPAYLGGPTL
jgi:hypothetical protein